jgi:uncharacterized protein
VDADAVEIRVLGSLVEKQRTTPDQYPLSLNALRLACNQATNRDPVVDYDETEIRAALDRLSRRGWVRLASGPGSRAAKFRHLLDDALGRVPSQIALLAVLMLRGAQTPGELKQRTERLHPFASLKEVDGVLERLIERELMARLPRRPGQKETRYRHLLAGNGAEAAADDDDFVPDERYSELEARLARVEEQLTSLLESLGRSSPPDALAVDADEVLGVGDDGVRARAAADDVDDPVR